MIMWVINYYKIEENGKILFRMLWIILINMNIIINYKKYMDWLYVSNIVLKIN